MRPTAFALAGLLLAGCASPTAPGTPSSSPTSDATNTICRVHPNQGWNATFRELGI